MTHRNSVYSDIRTINRGMAQWYQTKQIIAEYLIKQISKKGSVRTDKYL